MTFSAPQLWAWRANGVTTMRTTGSVEPYTDLSLKREIDADHLVVPDLDITGPIYEKVPALSSSKPSADVGGGRAADGGLLG